MIRQIEQTKQQNFLFFVYAYTLVYLSNYVRSAEQKKNKKSATHKRRDGTSNATATVVEQDKSATERRRTVTQDAGASAMRTLYDSLTFETIREGPTFRGGGFTTNSATQRVTPTEANHTEGERYRYITDDNDTTGTRYRATGENTGTARYTGINVTLYGRGEAVAMNYTASAGSRGGAAYLGKDILGSVRSTSNENGLLEDRYEYDAFGKPFKGELNEGMNLGYTGKPYDSATGLYNYGYRDYQPVMARFTTVDPIRDGNNWFAYVNNDPVNYVDLWGLSTSDAGYYQDAGMAPELVVPETPPERVFPTDSTRITSPFGPEHPPTGIDIGALTQGVRGDPVRSPVNGTVDFAGINPNSPSGSSYITITGTDGSVNRLLHTDNITVEAGSTVTVGQRIADMSDVGSPGQVHLHYEVYANREDYDNRRAIDPLSLNP